MPRLLIFSCLLVSVACRGGRDDLPRDDAALEGAARQQASPRPWSPPPPDPDDLPARGQLAASADLPPDRRALQVSWGRQRHERVDRLVDADEARARGLTLVDLSDGWAPAIFDDGVAAGGGVLPNRYRAIFTGLAGNRSDSDGQPIGPGEQNYLELYGVPPTLAVLRERFLADAARRCDPTFDVNRLLAVDSIETWGATTEQKELAKHQARGERLEAARVAAAAETWETLAVAQPKYAKDVKTHRRIEAERISFAEVEKRLACEGLLDVTRHKPGRYDSAMRKAMIDFQQKHAVMDQADIRRSTLETLARPLVVNDFLALRRVLTERAVHAGAILEDGTAPATATGPATYPGADGSRHPVPDLVKLATDALLARLAITDADDALAFFQRVPREVFQWLRVPVRFPPRPEYYSDTMDLSAEIDRGDIWYDFPYDEAGVRQPQPRERYPTFTLYVKWRGERVPLVRWRTTVGGWRGELAADGQEYFRYKDSDVGPRVWRHVVAAPVWIPPPSSPVGSMVKEKRVNGSFVKVTNFDETGPGYLSAYGLVAGIHEQARKTPEGTTYFDNGIRTHGSFDYMSLRGRFSHGCHRLYNNLAVRLFSYVLKHRRVRTLGSMALGFRRSFWWRGEIFEMRLPSRGFYYELDPPLPIETLEGRVKGTSLKPIFGYVRKPGVKYVSEGPPQTAETPESKAGGGVEAP